MAKFKHKNQEFYKELCKVFPSFDKRFQKSCETQWNDYSKVINVRKATFSSDAIYWEIDIPKTDIEQISELKTNVWYSSSEFDENPNKYSFIVENKAKNKYIFTTKIDEMPNWAVRFMYLKL